MQTLIGVKREQSQRFLENGTRIPVTFINIKDNRVVSIKTQDKDKYQAVQLGFGISKHATSARVGHAKVAGLDKAPKFLKEVRIYDDSPLPAVGEILNPTDVLHPGDIVDVQGFSKGKGYAGGVKRHGFHGGPKTHGQSDRHRAPGSIGQGTTPGRVYRGKRMAGKMGNENVTVQNLEVIEVNNDAVILKGLVPGVVNSLIVINKVGENKKFVPIYKDPADSVESSVEPKEEVSAEQNSPVEEPIVEETKEEISVEQGSDEVEPIKESEEKVEEAAVVEDSGEPKEDK